MSSSPLIIPTIAAIIAFLLYMLVMQITSRRDTMRERMQKMVDPKDLAPVEALPDPLRHEQELSWLGSLLDGLLRALAIDTDGFRKKNQLRFYQSGITSPDGPIYYLFFRRIGFIVFLVLAYLIFRLPAEGGADRLTHYLSAGLLAIIGIMGPDLYLSNSRTKRQKILTRSFPDALDLLLVCVESGLALDGALARVCKELGHARPEITMELNRTRLELTLLNDRTAALTNLAERTDMVPFRSLVATLLQSERFGTSLTETLRVLSDDYRHTRLMLAEEKAGKLPVLMTIPLITLMLPALFLIILGPAAMSIVAAFSNK